MATVTTTYDFLIRDPRESLSLLKKQFTAIKNAYYAVRDLHLAIEDTHFEDHAYFADYAMEVKDYIGNVEIEINSLEQLIESLPEGDYASLKQGYLDVNEMDTHERFHERGNESNEEIRYYMDKATSGIDFLFRNTTDRVYYDATDVCGEETDIDEEYDIAPDDEY